MSITEPIPNDPFNSAEKYSIWSSAGPLELGSGLFVTGDGVLLVSSSLGGTVNSVAAGTGLSGGTITIDGTISLNPATSADLGGIKVGSNLTISPDGTLNALAPGIGTITGVGAGSGLSGGGNSGAVTLSLNPATAGAIGGVRIGSGIAVDGAGTISLVSASTSASGGVQLATGAEVISGTDANKAVTPATLAAKVASTTAPGIVQLTDSVVTDSSTIAATATAVKAANTAAELAQISADNALPRSGGTMTGTIVFSPGQAFPGVSFPVASATALGVVKVGSGLSVTPAGVLSTANVGTVTSIQAGPGLGAPATGGQITTTGTISLLPPNGTQLGGVKAGTNITIAPDGVISVTSGSFLPTNNPYAYTSYVWPVSRVAPALPCPGDNGQVLTILDNTTGTLGWTTSGGVATITAGAGISAVASGTNVTVSLNTVPSVTPGTYGGTSLIPILTVNSYGQITSAGIANTYSSFINVPNTAPSVDLDFAANNLNRTIVLTGNTVINNPLNTQSGQRGTLVITQDAVTPYTIIWGSAWKFSNGTPYDSILQNGLYTGNPVVGATDLLEFTVIAADKIVVTNIVTSVY